MRSHILHGMFEGHGRSETTAAIPLSGVQNCESLVGISDSDQYLIEEISHYSRKVYCKEWGGLNW